MQHVHDSDWSVVYATWQAGNPTYACVLRSFEYCLYKRVLHFSSCIYSHPPPIIFCAFDCFLDFVHGFILRLLKLSRDQGVSCQNYAARHKNPPYRAQSIFNQSFHYFGCIAVEGVTVNAMYLLMCLRVYYLTNGDIRLFASRWKCSK